MKRITSAPRMTFALRRLGATVALISGPVLAQTTSPTALEPVVVTGTKGETAFGVKSGIPLEQMPQSVQVIDEAEIVERNAQSIGDILKSVPSAIVGADRTSTYQPFSVLVRGFRAKQIYNGVRHRYYWNVDPSALANIERVEVLKGPLAVLYGHTFGAGMISIITKRPQPDFKASVSGLLGSYDQKAGSFDLTGTLSSDARLLYRVTGEIERSGTFIDHTDLDRQNLNLSLTWEPTSAVKAYFVGQWQERETKRGTGLPVVGTVVSNGIAQVPISRYLGDPNHNFKASGPLAQGWADIKLNNVWTLTPRYSYSGFTGLYNELLLRDVRADRVTVNRTGRYDDERHRYSTTQLDLNGELDGFGLKHHLLFGTEYSTERIKFFEQTIPGVPPINALNPSYGPALTGPYAVTTVHARQIDSWAIYAQDRIDLTDRLNVIVGARSSKYNYHRETSTTFTSPVTVFDSEASYSNYQIGSSYRLGDGWSVYGGYSTGFDIQSNLAARSFSGQTFDPDQQREIEAGVRLARSGFIGSAAVFQINRSNVLTSDPDHPGFSIQTGAVRSRGMELEGIWQASREFSVQAGYAYTQGEVTGSNSGNRGFALADVPKHRANLFMRYDMQSQPIQFRAGVLYVGSRPFADTANVTVAPGLLANNVTLPSYTVLDLGVTYRFKRARLDLSIANATNKTYFTRDFNNFSVFPGAPRQAFLRLRVDF